MSTDSYLKPGGYPLSSHRFTGNGDALRERFALKRMHGNSAAGKATEVDESDLEQDRFISADPLLAADYPRAGSPCIDAGEMSFDFNGENFRLARDSFSGRAPDLGATETR